MRQDTDVARMAAALKTPSLKYRSFGNEAVRNTPAPPPPTEEQAFSILGDALAGVDDLPPGAVMGAAQGYPEPAYEPLPEPAPHLAYGEPAAYPVAPDPNAEVHHVASTPIPEMPPLPPAMPEPLPVAPPQRPAAMPAMVPQAPAMMPQAPAMTPQAPAPFTAPEPPRPEPPRYEPPRYEAPRHEPPRHPAQGSSLLQVLLGNAPPAQPPAQPSAQPVAPQAAAPAMPAAPPVLAPPLAATPVLPMPLMPAPLVAVLPAAASWPPVRGGTGSSLLDTLVGPASGEGAIHYPLLDALGAAMRGSPADPSPRHWPAARVDIALPELLRRVAAGVRLARSAA